MIAAAAGVDLWCSPEFREEDHQRRVQQAARFQIADESGEGLVDSRNMVAAF